MPEQQTGSRIDAFAFDPEMPPSRYGTKRLGCCGMFGRRTPRGLTAKGKVNPESGLWLAPLRT